MSHLLTLRDRPHGEAPWLRLYDEAPRLLAHSDGGVDDVDAMAVGMSDADGMKGKADGPP